MAAKKTDHEATALGALARLLTDPEPKVLNGNKTTPGIFGSGKADKEAAKVCQEKNWISKTGATVGKGKTQKDLYRITPEGVHAVLSRSDSSQLLDGLQVGLAQTVQKLHDVEARASEMVAQLHHLRAAVDPLQNAITHLGGSLKPPDLEEIRQRLQAGSTSTVSPPVSDSAPAALREQEDDGTVDREIEERLRDWKESGEPGDCSFSELYEDLRARHPELSIGRFHDALRRLQQNNRVRLVHWGRPLVELPEPNLALFVAHKVMYYAHIS